MANPVSICAPIQKAHMSVRVLAVMSYKEAESAGTLTSVGQPQTAALA